MDLHGRRRPLHRRDWDRTRRLLNWRPPLRALVVRWVAWRLWFSWLSSHLYLLVAGAPLPGSLGPSRFLDQCSDKMQQRLMLGAMPAVHEESPISMCVV